MPRAISKGAIEFGRIRVGADEISVWIDREAKLLIVGSREFRLITLSPEQLDRLDAMARAVLISGEVRDYVRRDLESLVEQLIRKNTH